MRRQLPNLNGVSHSTVIIDDNRVCDIPNRPGGNVDESKLLLRVLCHSLGVTRQFFVNELLERGPRYRPIFWI